MLVTQGALGNNFMGGGDPAAAAMQKEMEAALAANAPGYNIMQAFNTILGLIVSIALLVGGIALLSMVRWARTLTIVSCLVGIFDVALTGIYQVVFVIPAVKSFFRGAVPALMKQQNAPAPPKAFVDAMEMGATLGAVGAVIFYILIVIYFMVIILLLSRHHVRNAFAGVPARAGFDDDRFDRDRGESRRRDDFDDEDDDWNRPPPDDPKDDRFRV